MNQQQIYDAIASRGGWFTRKDVAELFGRLKSTCVNVMLERLVQKGFLIKQYGYYNSVSQPAWYYSVRKIENE